MVRYNVGGVKMEKLFYAVKNNDVNIRLKSSSGGVFHLFSESVYNEGGVVYGAIIDKEQNIVHYRSDDIKEIDVFKGSKYTQSKLNDTFKQVKKDLESNKKVLYSGTPCQIAAIKNYLKDISTDKLILIDIVCHGTPQKKYYDDYKRMLEKKYKGNIVSINFRYKGSPKDKKYTGFETKKKGPVQSQYNMYIKFDNNKEYIMNSQFDVYYQLYDYMVNEGCFKCPFANMNRNSDITIGDFHEFSSKLGEFNDAKGVSLVILNTQKGIDVFEKIKSNISYELKQAKDCIQPQLTKPLNKPKMYDEFAKDYESNGFEYVVNKYTRKSVKFKVKKTLYRLGLLEFLKSIKR